MTGKQSLTSILLNILSSTSLRIVYAAIIFGPGNVSCFVTVKQCWVSINNNKVTQDYTKESILEKYTHFEKNLKNKQAPHGCFPSVHR